MSKATRASFGEAILALADRYPELVILDADLSKSTQTQSFSKKYPHRWFECGIAESNMLGIGAGLALCGKIPFVCSFACFLVGRFETIRVSIGYNQANVRMVGTHCGIGLGEDGYTQMSTEDIACMRSLPHVAVIQPADDRETKQCIEYLMKHKGPAYIRLTRQKVPVVHQDDYKFQFGKADILREGKDVVIIATGGVVGESLKAAHILEKEGIWAQIVNIHTIKPIDKDFLIREAKRVGKFVTVEDHNIHGGLGGAVAEELSCHSPSPLLRIGVEDLYAESGTAEDLYKKYGLDAESIASKTLTFLRSR
ncbi:MAG: transketolase family protein [Deltaproteobacteria bacterium]|nr:transketolase family protein [Deltaproteobacteria bacterium]